MRATVLTIWLWLIVTCGVIAGEQLGIEHPIKPNQLTFSELLPPDSLRYGSIDSVLLAQCPGLTTVRVAQLLFVGNDVTKERILRAELDLREGDTLKVADLAERLERNRRRLFNLQLFNQVNAQASCREGEVIILFGLQERWYTIPVPIFSLADRNFRSWLDRPDRWRRFDYGLRLLRYNFRGRNEQLFVNLQLGFNRKYEIFYTVPSLSRRNPKLGVSAGASLVRSRAVDYITRDDQLLALRADNEFPIRQWYLTGGLRWRHTVQRLTTLEAFYRQDRISDSVRLGNPEFFLGADRRAHVELVLMRTINRRNTFAYPLTGSFLQATLAHRRYLSSPSPPITAAVLQYARYFDLGHGFYYSASGQARLRLTRRLAYFDSHALGFRQALVRGYDAYVVDGRHHAVLRQGLSFRLFDAGRLQLPVLDDPRLGRVPLVLYLNTFADAGFVAERSVPLQNRLPNEPLASAGIGLHLVTYYDRVFTFEYAHTRHGFGGFFFRTEFPI